MLIRAVRVADFGALQEIERAAGESFRTVGMPEVADDNPFSDEELEDYREAGLAWAAVDDSDRPVAYLIAEPVDGNLHIEQVSVHPSHARQGLGRQLIDYAAAQGTFPAVTLTSFAEVPWNAPYYVRCGFRILSDSELTPGLRAIRAREADHGLDRWPRVCLRREV